MQDGKKLLVLTAKFLLLLFIFISPALAQKQAGTVGVGLSWHDELIVMKNEFEEKCLSYGLYNPFDVDVTATLVADGDISKLWTRTEPEAVFVPAKTDPKHAKTITLCFKPKILRFPYCKNETWTNCFNLNQWVFQFPFYPITIKGGVVTSYVTGEQPISGTGSRVQMSIKAPLELMVGDITVFYRFIAVLMIISLAVVAFIFRKRLKVFYLMIARKTEEQRRQKLRELEEKIEKLKREKEKIKKSK